MAYKDPEKRKAQQSAYRQTPEFKAKLRAHRHKPEVKAKLRAYRQSPEVKAKEREYRRNYQQLPEVKARRREYRRNYQLTPQQKHNREVRLATNRAIRRGKLIRPATCSICLHPGHIEAHHWSYLWENRLDVEWLCRACHAAVHAMENERASE